MRIAAENRHEIWISFGVALLAILFVARIPMGYGDVLVLACCLLVSLCCALNAALEIEAMSIPGKFVAVIWLIVIFFANAWVLIWAFGIRDFANR
jgi:hypothetical protein